MIEHDAETGTGDRAGEDGNPAAQGDRLIANANPPETSAIVRSTRVRRSGKSKARNESGKTISRPSRSGARSRDPTRAPISVAIVKPTSRLRLAPKKKPSLPRPLRWARIVSPYDSSVIPAARICRGGRVRGGRWAFSDSP